LCPEYRGRSRVRLLCLRGGYFFFFLPGSGRGLTDEGGGKLQGNGTWGEITGQVVVDVDFHVGPKKKRETHERKSRNLTRLGSQKERWPDQRLLRSPRNVRRFHDTGKRPRH